MTEKQIAQLKEQLRKEIRSEIGRLGYKAGIGKLSYKKRSENGRKGGLARAKKLSTV